MSERFRVESGDHCRGLGRLRLGGKVAQIGTKQRSADRLPGAAPGYRRQRRNSSLLTRRWREADSNHRSRECSHRRLGRLTLWQGAQPIEFTLI